VIGQNAESEKYFQLAEEVGKAFVKAFLTSGKGFAYFGSDSQTSNAMPLSFESLIGNSTLKTQVWNSLVNNFAGSYYRNRTSCGEVGFPAEICVLAQNNRNDLLESMLMSGEGWGYRYILENADATTLTEAWNGARGESQNHFMLGHIDAWFYGVLGGINIGEWSISRFMQRKEVPLSFCTWWNFTTESVATVNVFLHPRIYSVTSVTEVNSWHWRQHTGNITVVWTNTPKEGYSLEVSVDPPAHWKTLLCLPLKSPKQFRGTRFLDRKDLRFIGFNEVAVCELYMLASGRHQFIVR